MNTRRSPDRVLWGAGLLTAALCAASAGLARRVIVNCTRSMPLGIYWLRPAASPALGTLVAFPIPPQVQKLVRQRRYLPARAMLMKPVVAVAGQVVCTRESVLTIDGTPFGVVASEDSRERPLPHADLCGAVPAGTIYVASRHPGSFDSRVFGVVAESAVRGTVTPLWTW